jgi:hypothetical protein
VFFESAKSRASSAWSDSQSIPTSIENGTNACAFSVEMVGFASVGALSVVSVASAENPAVTPARRANAPPRGP